MKYFKIKIKNKKYHLKSIYFNALKLKGMLPIFNIFYQESFKNIS